MLPGDAIRYRRTTNDAPQDVLLLAYDCRKKLNSTTINDGHTHAPEHAIP